MEKPAQRPDIGDYLKLVACSAVMLQTILAFALTEHPSETHQFGIGIIYNLIKFTAPAFIFAILFTTSRLTMTPQITYGAYLKQQWHATFAPTILWTSVYLIVTPELQQVRHFHDLRTFLWQFINGNAAPHLWYNTMMMQFVILMPAFWFLAHWIHHRRGRARMVIGVTTLIYLGWLVFYDQQVFHGPHMHSWYLLDRVFISFLIYGVLGMLAWEFRLSANRIFRVWWPMICLLFLGSFYWTNQALFNFGYPVRLINAPYYKPSMMIYDLTVITLIAAFGIFQIDNQPKIAKVVHNLANYAYKAFLGNAFWIYLLWMGPGRSLTTRHLWIGIGLIYIGTWLLSFGSAFGLHVIWQQIRHLTKEAAASPTHLHGIH